MIYSCIMLRISYYLKKKYFFFIILSGNYILFCICMHTIYGIFAMFFFYCILLRLTAMILRQLIYAENIINSFILDNLRSKAKCCIEIKNIKIEYYWWTMKILLIDHCLITGPYKILTSYTISKIISKVNTHAIHLWRYIEVAYKNSIDRANT